MPTKTKTKVITFKELIILCSGDFLCENLPDNYDEMNDKTFDEYLVDNAWVLIKEKYELENLSKIALSYWILYPTVSINSFSISSFLFFVFSKFFKFSNKFSISLLNCRM